MALTLSCAFATSMSTPEHVELAEELGYERAWLYDSPALYPDVWVTLARCAERTSTIGLGPGVLIPSLRHPMANASAIATLVELAGPGRVAVAVGSGFTGRLTLGQRPLAWRYVGQYVRALRGLLRGEIVEWEGAKMQMLHPEGYGGPRPLDVPILVAAAGPKGVATARELGDGAFIAAADPVPGFDWSPVLFLGTVLDEGEPPTSERVMAAAGHGAAVYYHFWFEAGRPMSDLPQGPEWEKGYTDVPADVRHLAMHDQHLVAVNERDARFLTPELLAQLGIALAPGELQERLAALEQAGATEVAYQPAGPDIRRELEAFAAAARG